MRAGISQSVGDIVTSCVMDESDLIPDRGRKFSPRHFVRTGSDDHPAPYQMGTRAWSWPLTSI